MAAIKLKKRGGGNSSRFAMRVGMITSAKERNRRVNLQGKEGRGTRDTPSGS